ncbi:MAG: endolytic transglycosylase MltG [Desulfosudaceae bacterium]
MINNKFMPVKFKSIATGFLVLALLATIGGAGAWWYLYDYASSPADPGASGQVVEVPPGAGFSLVAARLHQRGIIDKPDLFKILIRTNHKDGVIKAGEYRLSGAMPPADILDKLIRGEVILHQLTVPEGYNIDQIAGLVGQVGLAEPDDFVAAAHQPDLIESLGIAAVSLEGYLFPETYYFEAGVSPIQIVETMVDRFLTVFDQSRQERAEELGLSRHQIVILASIIEKETSSARERPLISSVFHNRLAKGMRLDSDPTVIYGIEAFDGDITRKHLNTPTPYNTYRLRGLPAGPIANPGEASLEAALYPAETKYLYFVSRKDGTHHFSTNLSEHNRAVRKYQLGR